MKELVERSMRPPSPHLVYFREEEHYVSVTIIVKSLKSVSAEMMASSSGWEGPGVTEMDVSITVCGMK